ncbi:pilus assembly PilX family protein [Pseudomonas sp. XK-1]|uniref:pilus assembly PilX family protein n=1 Tax=Pseudomonas sp. XK-1 TaxID=3136019 RepID=UPI0031194AEC
MKRLDGVARQRGIVLMVALIMLLLVSLMVISGFNLSQTNLQVVHNLESRALAKQAAIRALEEAVSSNLFLTGTVFPVACEQANRVCYDLNGDGANDIAVQVTLGCTIAKTLTNAEVLTRSAAYSAAEAAEAGDAEADGGSGAETVEDPSVETLPQLPVASPWLTCIGGGQASDIGGGTSQCADVVWDFVATATDLQTGAQAQVRQGLATPADINQVSNVCD